MKHYFITTNYTLASQVPIQQSHAHNRMFLKILDNPKYIEMFRDFMTKETSVMLNVGQPNSLLSIYSFIVNHKDEFDFPYDIFLEPSENYTPTCFSFIAPEKFTYNINRQIDAMLSSEKMFSLYDFALKYKDWGGSYEYEPHKHFKLVFDMINGVPSFTITFNNLLFKSDQNEEMMETDIYNEEKMKKVHEKLNKDDFMFYNDLNEKEKDFEEVTITETYSLPQLVFLHKIKSLSLKK